MSKLTVRFLTPFFRAVTLQRSFGRPEVFCSITATLEQLKCACSLDSRIWEMRKVGWWAGGHLLRCPPRELWRLAGLHLQCDIPSDRLLPLSLDRGRLYAI